ncbi:MAG: DUF1887 family protein [Saprospiraceae bacterium]|nr:DUF1887 family protein [Saprospiraceae bacterium]
MTLLQLLSNQTLQNLLPIIALQPERVLSVASRGGFLNTSDMIKRAYDKLREKHGDLREVEFLPYKETASQTPDVQEAQEVALKYANQYPDLCVNFTGATKMMSIGAYLVAKDKGLPTYYCDTQSGWIVAGGTGTEQEQIDIGSIFDKLDVEVILEAYGKSLGKHWRSQPRTDAEIAFGKTAFSLVQGQQYYFHRFIHSVRKSAEPGTPLPVAPNAAVEAFLHQALALGYLERNASGAYILPFREVYKDAKAKNDHKDHMLAHLDGFPFEYYVYDLVRHSTRYAAPLSNVEPVGDPISFGEVDIICVDKKDKGLACISCKGSNLGAQKLEHLESFVQRANTLGGSFSKKILCVASEYFGKKGGPDYKQLLTEKCKSLKIELLIGSDIRKHFTG